MIDEHGLARILDGVGEATILARFGGQVAIARILIPSLEKPPPWEPPVSDNLVDGFVFGKLRALNLAPAPACTDAEFARGSALDLCGILPTPGEVEECTAGDQADKRALWVDRLLERPEYADLFAMKWGALLRNQRSFGAISQPGTFAFHDWIRQSLAENRPYDRFVAAIVAARGDATQHPPVVWYRQGQGSEGRGGATAQLFLAVGPPRAPS